MQDHIYFGPSYRVNAPTISALGYPEFAAQAAEDFNTRAAGMYTNPVTDVLAWEKLPEPLRSQSLSNASLAALATLPDDWPELEHLSLSVYLGWQNDSRAGDPHDGFNYASLAVALVAPQSRGNLTINSTDTADPPLINPNFLSAPADVELAVAGYKRAREFWATEAMQPFLVGGEEQAAEAFPGPEVASDAQILDVIKRSYNTVYHASCTCAMGKPDDPMAVVDTQGRVYGVRGLRVVDASIFPSLPPGHPMATVCKLCFVLFVGCVIAVVVIELFG
jgi:choline dehydrogenase